MWGGGGGGGGAEIEIGCGLYMLVSTDYSTEVPTYTVDLDQDPKLRWQKLVTDKKDDVSKRNLQHMHVHFTGPYYLQI